MSLVGFGELELVIYGPSEFKVYVVDWDNIFGER